MQMRNKTERKKWRKVYLRMVIPGGKHARMRSGVEGPISAPCTSAGHVILEKSRSHSSWLSYQWGRERTADVTTSSAWVTGRGWGSGPLVGKATQGVEGGHSGTFWNSIASCVRREPAPFPPQAISATLNKMTPCVLMSTQFTLTPFPWREQ